MRTPSRRSLPPHGRSIVRPVSARGLRCSLFLALLASSAHGARAGEPVRFFDIEPGATTRAQVELMLGDPRQKLEATDLDAYEYTPPREAKDASRVVISYYRDSKVVGRVDAYLLAPVAPDALRDAFGTRLISRRRPDGRHEELFATQGLILEGDQPPARALAISFLAPRTLAYAFVLRSVELRRAKSYEDALVQADKAVTIDPDYASGYLEQGHCLAALQRLDQAKLRYLVATNAKYHAQAKAAAHRSLADLYENTEKQPAQAEAEHRSALALLPRAVDNRVAYAQFLWRQKRTEDAGAEWNRVLELDANNIEAHRGLVDVLREKKDVPGERAHLDVLLKWAESPEMTDQALKAVIHSRQGDLLAKEGKKPQAVDAYRRSLELSPRSVWTYQSLGQVLLELYRPQEAEAVFRQGLQVDPRHLMMARGLIQALLDLERFDEARQQAEASLDFDPQYRAGQMVQTARAWAAAGKKKEALQWLTRAVSAGYPDRQYLVTDRYFEKLQKDDHFRELLEKIR
jgi:tetratricopeptide (TPR) repeat protein